MTYEYNRRRIKGLWGSSSRRRFLSSELCDMGCGHDGDLHIALSWAIEPPLPRPSPTDSPSHTNIKQHRSGDTSEHQSPSLPLNFSSPRCFPKDVHAAKIYFGL